MSAPPRRPPVAALAAALLLYAALVGAAFFWDSVRLLRAAHAEATAAAAEVRRQDERLAALPAPSGPVDPTDPLERRAADERAGALNRRALASRRRDETAAAYEAFAAGLRGRIARRWTGLPAAAPAS